MDRAFIIKCLIMIVIIVIIVIGAVLGVVVKEGWKYSVGFWFGYLVASIGWKV